MAEANKANGEAAASPADATVKMTDGREVLFKGKRKLLKEVQVDGNSVSVRFDFRNGQTRTYFLGECTSPTPLFLEYAGHGGSQKLGDETAGLEDPDDMVEATDQLYDQLAKGEWRAERESSGFAGTSILLKALVEYSGKSVEQIREFLKTLKPAEKQGLRTKPGKPNKAGQTLKGIVERLEAEKAAKATAIDTDSLFDKLDAIPEATA